MQAVHARHAVHAVHAGTRAGKVRGSDVTDAADHVPRPTSTLLDGDRMTDQPSPDPGPPPGRDHVRLVDLPERFDESDRRRFTDMLNWLNTVMLVTCNRTDPVHPDPLPLVLFGTAIPHPRLLELMHAGVATMADNLHRSFQGGREDFRRELIAQALAQETALPVERGRAYAGAFCDRMDRGEDEQLIELAALTRDGFHAFALAVSDPEADGETMVGPLREIAIGCRVLMGSVLHLLIQDLESILGDLGITLEAEEVARYREMLAQVLRNVQS